MVSSSSTVSLRTARVSSSSSHGPARRSASSRRTSGGSYRTSRRGSRGSGRNGNGRKRNGGRGGKRHLILKWFLGIVGTLLGLGILAFAYLYITTEVPAAEKIALASKTTVYYADGKSEIGSFADQNREIIDCKVLPAYVGQAVVASENRSFYSDRGIDLKGVARALVNNITTGSRQGGSTITQQYAERYYLGETTSYSGKLHEAFLALKIAQTQDKNQVLCNYMNTIYLGRGAYGIQAAAQAYFGKDAKDLSLQEAALLAGIIPAPTDWDPAVGPKEAGIRFNRVLRIMKEDGYISAKDASSSTIPKTVEARQQNSFSGPSGYLMEMVREELTKNGTFSKEDLDTGGYRIITTIDKAKQDEMYRVASPTQDGKGTVPEGLQVGSISLDPRTGGIISIYGGDDYLAKQLNNATQAIYEPGSTMKPFALLAAVQQGMSLNTTFNGNSPRTYDGIAAPVQNFANMSYGYINMYSATANSVNTVYMELQQDLGTTAVAKTANQAGISAKRVTGKNPFTVLGNDGVHVSELAQAYATIANQGVKTTMHIVADVTDHNGKDMYQAQTQTERVFTAHDTALVTKAMQGTIQNGTGSEALAVGRNLAGKSGTANDSTAGSFVGFSPNTVSVFAIWYPDANGNPQVIPPFGAYTGGSDYPLHLFTAYMTQAMANMPNEPFPAVTDDGKIGGPNGTWGTGSRTWQQQQSDEAAKRKAQADADAAAKQKAQEDADAAKKAQDDADADAAAKQKADEDAARQREQESQQTPSPTQSAQNPDPTDTDNSKPSSD